MKRGFPVCLLILCLLFSGCTVVRSFSVEGNEHTSAAAAESPSPDDEVYQPHRMDVTVEALGITLKPASNTINGMTLEPSGDELFMDGEGWLPGDGSLYSSVSEAVERMAAEEEPLRHDGALQVLANGNPVAEFSYTIHDGETYRKISGETALQGHDGVLTLPKESGRFYVSILITWDAPESFPDKQRAYETWQYVFTVQYAPALATPIGETMTTVPAASPSVEDAIYHPHPQDVTVEALGVTVRPESQTIHEMVLSFDGIGVCADCEGWLPGDGAMLYDTELKKAKTIAEKQKPLLYNGELHVLADGAPLAEFSYMLYDCETFQRVSDDPDMKGVNGVALLPKEEGVFLVNLVVTWAAAQPYPGVEHNAYESRQYVFPVQFASVDNVAYQPRPQVVTVEAQGVTLKPACKPINAMTLGPDGGGLQMDAVGWLPGDGATIYDGELKEVRRMAAEEEPLRHDGELRVLADGEPVADFSYTIHDGKTFQKISGEGPEAGKDGILSLPAEDGVFFVNILITWVAAEVFTGASDKACETLQYAFPVQYSQIDGK